ncbi:MAG: hypothetical protein WAM97_17115 [Acidimicrobiales bacterium]
MPDDIVHSNGSQNDNDGADRPTPRVGRRKMLLGVAAAGVGASVVAEAEPASATDGNPVLIGEANKAKATTSITTTKGNGLQATTSQSGQIGVEGVDTSSGGTGVYGNSTDGNGVYGYSAAGAYGVVGNCHASSNGTGVYGVVSGDDGIGVWGNSTGDNGMGVQGIDQGSGTEGIGLYGSSRNGTGVYGTGEGCGVYGTALENYGVYGTSPDYGVYGTSDTFGVFATSTNGTALFADGNADVTGTLSKGGGSFKIDHPVDPGGKYLYHSFVESPDMKNVYDGTAILDGDGSAIVELPDWFEALNRDFRYTLTALDVPAPDLHISSRIKDAKFSIAGGRANQEVSWQVTGIRQDAWANANRIPVEVDKKDEDRGRYLHPELFDGEAITALAKARDRGRRHRTNTPMA